MAEVAAAASVLGIASFAIEVSKGLLAAGKVLVQARGQIARLTKHVSQFGAVIRQVGLVLKRDGPGLCSSELLREIRRIVRSCHATLKEIHFAATSSLEKPLAAVRWLFVKGKAKELEAQLESQKVMLQIMMHTVTVSRLGQLRKSSVEDAEQAARVQAQNAEQTSRIQAENAEKTSRIQAENAEQTAHLRAEIELLKTLIVNGHHEIGKLRRTETTEAQQSHESQEQKSSSGSSEESSESSDETADTNSSSDESSSDGDDDKKTPEEQASEHKRGKGLLTASEYDSRPTNEESADQLDEALRSTRLLLDKWTIPGSESAMTALGEKSAVVSTNPSSMKGFAYLDPHEGFSREHPTNDIVVSEQDILFERVSLAYISDKSIQKDVCNYFKVTPAALSFYENRKCVRRLSYEDAIVFLYRMTPTTRVLKNWMDAESLVKHGLTSFRECQLTWVLDGDINFKLISSCIHDTYKRYLEPSHADAAHNGSNDHRGGPWTANSPRLAVERYIAFKRRQDRIWQDHGLDSKDKERSGRYPPHASANSEKDEGKQRTYGHKQSEPDHYDARKASVDDKTTSNGDASNRNYYRSKKDRTSVKDANQGDSPGPSAKGPREAPKPRQSRATNREKQFRVHSGSRERTGRGNTSGGVEDSEVEIWERRRPSVRSKANAEAESEDSEVERFMAKPTLRRTQTMPLKQSTERKNAPTRQQGTGRKLLFEEVPPGVAFVPRIGRDDVRYHASRRRAEPEREERKGKGKDKERDEQPERTAETKAQTKERAKDARRRNETTRKAYAAYVESESDDSEIETFVGQKRGPHSVY